MKWATRRWSTAAVTRATSTSPPWPRPEGLARLFDGQDPAQGGLAHDGGAVDDPPHTRRRAGGAVHQAPVVPQHHVALAPGVKVVEGGVAGVLDQAGQQLDGLVVAQPGSLGSEQRSEERRVGEGGKW